MWKSTSRTRVVTCSSDDNIDPLSAFANAISDYAIFLKEQKEKQERETNEELSIIGERLYVNIFWF